MFAEPEEAEQSAAQPRVAARSAMTFGGHWRRRVAVEIGRGRVNCLGRSADPGYKGNRRSSAETAPYELR